MGAFAHVDRRCHHIRQILCGNRTEPAFELRVNVLAGCDHQRGFRFTRDVAFIVKHGEHLREDSEQGGKAFFASAFQPSVPPLADPRSAVDGEVPKLRCRSLLRYESECVRSQTFRGAGWHKYSQGPLEFSVTAPIKPPCLDRGSWPAIISTRIRRVLIVPKQRLV
jgi:hypothetical protein